MEPQSSSAVGGAAVFGERSKELLEMLATMKCFELPDKLVGSD
jgi:hypothetical protein